MSRTDLRNRIQEGVFLLDGAIFPGSSGSPVMMIDQNGYIDRYNRFVPVRRVFFLGGHQKLLAEKRCTDEGSEPCNGEKDGAPSHPSPRASHAALQLIRGRRRIEAYHVRATDAHSGPQSGR